MEITYLLNSGFLVRVGQTVLVFDDYADPRNVVERVIADGDFARLYFFVSHGHFDHFDAHILHYAPSVTNYIVSYEIRRMKRGKMLPADKTVFLPNYSEWSDDAVSVRSFSSTDVGTSYLVFAEGRKIFHAGDFNLWRWNEDTEENKAAAEDSFMRQLKKMTGINADVAFFPLDGRLGETQSEGARLFCRATNVKALVAMHNVGFPRWRPPTDFFAVGREIPYWSPVDSGEFVKFDKGEFAV